MQQYNATAETQLPATDATTRAVWTMYVFDHAALIADDGDTYPDRAALASAIREHVEYDVIGDPSASDEPLTVTLARAMCVHVNWRLIADAIANEYPEIIRDR